MSQPRIVITAGEPAGVGPDVVLRALQFEHAANIAVIGDIGVLRDRAGLLGISCDIHCLDKPEDVLPHTAGRLQVLHTPCVLLHVSHDHTVDAGQEAHHYGLTLDQS